MRMVLTRDILAELVRQVFPPPDTQPAAPDRWSEQEFKVFLQFARYHRVIALLAHRIAIGEASPYPEPWNSFMARELHRSRLQHILALERLAAIEKSLHSKEISFVTLKGPRLAEEAYPSSGLRPFEDLDMLVDPSRRLESEQALISLGYKPLGGEASLPFIARYHFHTQWQHPDTGQLVELHWRPADSRTLPRRPGPAPTFLEDLKTNPAIMPIYLAVHLSKHGIANAAIRSRNLSPLLALHPWCDTRLIWLLDFTFLVESRKLTREQLHDAADSWHVRPALETILHLTGKVGIVATGNGSPFTPVPRGLSFRNRLLQKVSEDLEKPASWSSPPWWLKPNPWTGFRPVRILDLFRKQRT